MKKKFWSPERIDKTGAEYRVILSQRSTGKTFSILRKVIENYVKTGKQSVVLRRWNEDIVKSKGLSYFRALEYDAYGKNHIEQLTGKAFNTIVYKNRAWYLAYLTADGIENVVDTKPFAYARAITAMEHNKGESMPEVNIIVFDEFMSRNYVTDEFMLFQNSISTIIRGRDDVVIYMLGNLVNIWSPYFDEFGLSKIKTMQAGDIDIYSYGDNELTLAVELIGEITGNKGGSKYHAFDNPKLGSITKAGIFEMNLYPHLTKKFKPKDVVFNFFIIISENDIIQGDVIYNDDIYISLHKKTTPLKNPDEDLIYTLDDNPAPNYCSNLLRGGIPPVSKRIATLFANRKVFYDSNLTGEKVRNFIMQSNTSPIK